MDYYWLIVRLFHIALASLLIAVGTGKLKAAWVDTLFVVLGALALVYHGMRLVQMLV